MPEPTKRMSSLSRSFSAILVRLAAASMEAIHYMTLYP